MTEAPTTSMPMTFAHLLGWVLRGWEGRRLALFAALALGWALAGCAPELLSPELNGLSPRYGFRGEDTPVVVTGADLYPQLNAVSGGDINLGVDFELYLVNEALGPPVALRGLERVDGEALRAWVPAGAAPGTYDLALRREGGGDRLAAAFTVTDTRADHIEVRVPDLSVAVRSSARVELQVVDPNGDDVALPIDVAVRAERLDGSVGGVWFDGGLVGQVSDGDGGLRGALTEAGRATLRLSSDEITQLRVGVDGLDGAAFLNGEGAWIAFEAGTVGGVLVEINVPEGGVVAGEAQTVRVALVDRFGNPTQGESAWLTLHETCPASGRGFEDFIRVDDELLLSDVVLTGATHPEGCPGNQLRAFGSADVDELVGLSEPFEVSPGPLSRLTVEAARATVTAGTQVQPLWVEALDLYGNTVYDAVGVLTLSDTVGGLDSAAGVGGASCTGFYEGVAACDALLVRAATGVRVRAVVGAAAGQSAPFDVVADAPQRMTATAPGSSARAGEPFPVGVAMSDAYGNAVVPTAAWLAELTVADGTAGLRCAADPDAAAGALLCTTEFARAGAVITAAVPSLGLSASTDAFDVFNGDLARVDLSLDRAGPIEAGERVGVLASGFDAFGNPYSAGPTATVELQLAVGGLVVGSLILDSGGIGAANPQIVVAGRPQAILAVSAGVERGRSADFDVTPAAFTRLELLAPQAWAPVGEPLTVALRATDVFGNTCTDVADPVVLRSSSGLGLPQSGVLSAGEASLAFTFEQRGLGDTLIADVGGLSASSPAIDAVQLDCVDGPAAALLLDGQAELRLCRVSGSTPVVSMSAAASVAGAATVGAWHFNVGDGEWHRSSSGNRTASWQAAGGYLAQVVVADTRGCGDLASARSWVGETDGQPVGPVSLLASRSELAVDVSATSSAVVTVEATDCLGDPAAGATILLHAELGEITGLSGALVAPGDGLRLSLDSDGRGAVGWSVLGAPGGVDAKLRAGVPSGAAYGALEVAVSGDTLAPSVIALSPAGRASGLADRVTVRFSEPMWAGSVNATRAALRDAVGAAVGLSSLALSADGQVLELVPVTPLDLDSVQWSVFLSGDLRDEAGSRLNGTGAGARTDLVLQLGDVADNAPGLSACAASAAAFQPDGDPGPGELGERVSLSAVADGAPDRWRLSVWDEAGDLVRVVDLLSASVSGAVEWDGRGSAGAVLPAGDYLVELVALDANWSSAAPCEALVQLRVPFPWVEVSE